MKEPAQRLVSGAGHPTHDWRRTYGSIEDLDDGQGHTAGTNCTREHPDNGLAAYLPALREKDPHADTPRIGTAQRRFRAQGNLRLRTPLVWEVHGETFRFPESPTTARCAPRLLG